MNLGITVFDDRLLLAGHSGDDKLAQFCDCSIKQKPKMKSWPGHIWNLVETAAGNMYRMADKLVLAVPGSICYLKKLEIDSGLLKEYPDYLEWVACIQIPGDLAKYKYDFISIGQSYDDSRIEMIFSAILIEPLNKLIYLLKRNNDPREIIPIPEQLGLIKVLEKSLGNHDIPQAGIVNCDNCGATLVILKNNKFSQSKYFPIEHDHKDNFTIDIETYLMSQGDSSDPLPVVVTGIADMFIPGATSTQPSFLPDNSLEFAGAWGVAEYVHSLGDK